jgi:hypothetical protein|tara:strand:+ start:257 stop:979 length:723 start_codon:yes stop_codon:yes gene_type:complete
MSELYFTKKALSEMKLMKKMHDGPFDIGELLKFTKDFKNIPEDFKSEKKILERFPNIIEVTIYTNIYNDNFKRNIIRRQFIVKDLILTNQESEINKAPSNNITENIDNDTGENGFKIYRSSKFNPPVKTNSLYSKGNNNSSFGRYNSSESQSLVIKNLPNDYNANDLRDELQHIFNTFIYKEFKFNGRICRASVLTSGNQIKGVAFIDFYNSEHLDSVLASTERFKIGFNILNIEKKKKK